MTMELPPGTGQMEPPEDNHEWVFGFIPGLKHLLPKMRGIPGFSYAQICTTNLWKAQDQDWLEVDGTAIYIIRGPKGDATMKLYTRGKRMPGQPHDAGARVCLVDQEVEKITGLKINGEEDGTVNESEGSEVVGTDAASTSSTAGTDTSASVGEGSDTSDRIES